MKWWGLNKELIRIDYLITENFNLRVAAVEDGRRISGVIVSVNLQMKRETLQKSKFAY